MSTDGRRSSVPWSSMEIDLKMRQVSEALEDAVALQKALAEAAAQAKNTFELAEAQFMLQARRLTIPEGESKWTVDEKKAWVVTQTSELELAADIADAHHVAQRTVVRALETEADLLRSLARSGRDAFEGPGSGIPRR